MIIQDLCSYRPLPQTIWDEGQKYIDVEDIEYDPNMYTHEEMEIIDAEIAKGTIDKAFEAEYKSILENDL